MRSKDSWRFIDAPSRRERSPVAGPSTQPATRFAPPPMPAGHRRSIAFRRRDRAPEVARERKRAAPWIDGETGLPGMETRLPFASRKPVPRERGRARRHEPSGHACRPMLPGHGISCERHFLFLPGSVNGWKEAAGNAVRQAPRPPAAGSPEWRCAPRRVERSGAVQTMEGPHVTVRQRTSGRLLVAGKGRHVGEATGPHLRFGFDSGASAADPRRSRIGVRRRTNRAGVARAGARRGSRTVTGKSAPKRRPVPKRGDRSSRTGPCRGVACRAAGGPKRRVGDGRFGPRGRSGEERKAGAAPGGPEGPRGVRKGTRKQWFASRFRGRGTGFPGAVLLAITVVIRSKMSISFHAGESPSAAIFRYRVDLTGFSGIRRFSPGADAANYCSR